MTEPSTTAAVNPPSITYVWPWGVYHELVDLRLIQPAATLRDCTATMSWPTPSTTRKDKT